MSADPLSPSPRSHRKLKAVLLLLLVFLLGNISGAGSAALIMFKRLQSNLRNPVTADSAGSRFLTRVGRDLDKDLKLNPEERAAVAEEIDVTRVRLRDIRTGLSRDVRGLSRDTVERISRRLPEEKRALLRERVRERLKPWGLEQGEPEIR